MRLPVDPVEPALLEQEEIERFALEMVGREIQRIRAREKKDLGLSDKDLERLSKVVRIATGLRKSAAANPDPSKLTDEELRKLAK